MNFLPDKGEHKFDSTRNRKLGVEKWKKKSGLAFQKVAKTSMVILEKKGPVVGGIDYVRYLSVQKVKQLQANATNT